MKTSTTALENLGIVAQLFERMDQHPDRVDAAQYRAVAQRLAQMLADATPGTALDALLQNHPAVCELYENQRYADAGLCRSPLQATVDAEVRAHDALERIRSAAAAASAKRQPLAPGESAA